MQQDDIDDELSDYKNVDDSDEELEHLEYNWQWRSSLLAGPADIC